VRELLKRILLGALAGVVIIGALGAIVGWATGHNMSTTIAGAYYIIGAILFLIGMAPAGGFSLIRGTMSRRRPTGSRQEPIFLLGLVLVGLGVAVDITRPF